MQRRGEVAHLRLLPLKGRDRVFLRLSHAFAESELAHVQPTAGVVIISDFGNSSYSARALGAC